MIAESGYCDRHERYHPLGFQHCEACGEREIVGWLGPRRVCETCYAEAPAEIRGPEYPRNGCEARMRAADDLAGELLEADCPGELPGWIAYVAELAGRSVEDGIALLESAGRMLARELERIEARSANG